MVWGSLHDPASEYAERINGNPSHLRCKFCGHTMWGGLTRFKQHLAQTGNDVIACSECPSEVTMKYKEEIINRILQRGAKKRQRRDSPENVRNNAEVQVKMHPPAEGGSSSHDVDAEEEALIEQAIKESIQTHELENKKQKTVLEAELEAAYQESMRSYQEELRMRGEGCSRYNAGLSDSDDDLIDIDLYHDSDSS